MVVVGLIGAFGFYFVCGFAGFGLFDYLLTFSLRFARASGVVLAELAFEFRLLFALMSWI